MVSQTCGNPLISAVDLSKHFVMTESFLSRRLAGTSNRHIKAIDGVSMSVYPHQTVGLVGESGCGKSTFGRLLVGLLQPTRGQVYYGGEPIWSSSGINRSDLRQHAQIIFQNPYSSLNPRYTVRQTINIALSAGGIAPRDREKEACSLMKRVGLSTNHLDRYPHQLSGGQRQRVGIARALATCPDFIVADEPLSSLDVSVQAQIISLLEDLQNEYGLSYLLIAHDLRVVWHMCDRVAVMYSGQIVESAQTDDLYEKPLHPYTQQLLRAIPGSGNRRQRSRTRDYASNLGHIGIADAEPDGHEQGCQYWRRCSLASPICKEQMPELVARSTRPADRTDGFLKNPTSASRDVQADAHLVRCHIAHR